MGNALNRYIANIPSVFNPETNTVLHALLFAIASSDDDVESSIALAKMQMFVRTATGQYLDILGKSRGVQRPPTLGLPDVDYQNLIPNLSLKPKQIRKAFYDTADVFFGPTFSRANFSTANSATFDIVTGDSITISVDGGPLQTVKVLAGDIAAQGLATSLEMQAILSRINGVTVDVLTDIVTGDETLNMRTNTPGPVGSLNISSTSTMVSPTKLDFPIGKFTILNLDQRVAVYNIRPNELFIEIPAVVPALKRTLKGSHHFHADATLAGPVPPADGIWQGSFFYDPTGSVDAITITGQKANIQQTITKQSILTSVAVDSTVGFLSPSGSVMFGYGTSLQEGPVKYRGIPNANTILLDPGYVFKNDHAVGTTMNAVLQSKPYVPRVDGTDLAIYLTSPSSAREIVQGILESLAAAGIVVTFKVLAPNYVYLIDNPYVPLDTPSIAPES